MSAGAATPTAPGARRWAIEALKQGSVALGWTVVAAQIYSFLIYFMAGMPYRPWSFVKIGWLYVLSFSRVGLNFTVGGQLAALANGGAQGEVVYRLHVAFLAGTALAAWMLFRAGRRTASPLRFSALGKAASGATVAIPYAGIAFLGSLVAAVRFPAQGVPMIRPVGWEALAFPLVMAGICGAAGGLSTAAPDIRAGRIGGWIRWVEGGWLALEASLGLAIVGLLLLAAIYPGGTAAYVRWLVGHGRTGALAFAHQLLALPNHAVFLLAPAIGGCDTLAAAGRSAQMMCPGSILSPQLLLFVPIAHGVPPAEAMGLAPISLPWVFRLFAAVPFMAAALGGRRAARDLEGASWRIAAGLGAGAVFAALVVAASWAAGISLFIPGVIPGPSTTAVLGPELGRTGALALAWGLAGGAIGGLAAVWRSVAGQDGAPVPEPGEPEDPPAPGPGRPTSV